MLKFKKPKIWSMISCNLFKVWKKSKTNFDNINLDSKPKELITSCDAEQSINQIEKADWDKAIKRMIEIT